VAVGRFFENPIQNNFSGIDSRHRNPRPRKSRGIDVGGYMRERVWSWETGEGHPTSISAAGARREAVAGAIRRMRPLNAARRRGGSLLKRPLGVDRSGPAAAPRAGHVAFWRLPLHALRNPAAVRSPLAPPALKTACSAACARPFRTRRPPRHRPSPA